MLLTKLLWRLAGLRRLLRLFRMKVASAPTAEQVAEVAAEPLSFAGVAVESISMPEDPIS